MTISTSSLKRPVERIAVVVDPHMRGRPPRARIDDFAASLTEKLNWVVEYCNEQNINAMLIPGDLFDSFAASMQSIGTLAVILNHFYGAILTIPGNHDLVAGNPETIWRTPYNLLDRLGIIHNVATQPFYIWPVPKKGRGICVTGVGYNYATDTPEGAGDFTSPLGGSPDCVNIHMVHNMLLAHRPGFEMRHTLIDEVKTNADVIITGHDHSGFGVIRRSDGVLFVNPGSISRLSASESEMRRQVSIAVLDVYDDGSVEGRLVPVPVAKPAIEVLTRENIERADRRNEELEAFLSLLSNEGESRFLDLQEIIEDVAKKEKLPTEVKKEALRRISAARETLGGER